MRCPLPLGGVWCIAFAVWHSGILLLSVSTNLWRRLLPALGNQVQFHFWIEWNPVSIWWGCLQLSQALTMSSSSVPLSGICKKHLLSPVSAAASSRCPVSVQTLEGHFQMWYPGWCLHFADGCFNAVKISFSTVNLWEQQFHFSTSLLWGSTGQRTELGAHLYLGTRKLRIVFILGFSMLRQV